MKEILPISKKSEGAFTLKKKQNQTERSLASSSPASSCPPSGEGLVKGKQRGPSIRLMKKTISVGAFCELKVTALGPKDMGIDEFSYGFSILIPKAKLGETVKVQIKRIFNFKKAKYAVAQRCTPKSVPSPSSSGTNKNTLQTTKQHLNIGDILTVKLDHVAISEGSCIGLVNLLHSDSNGPSTNLKEKSGSSRIIIPLNSQINGEIAKVGQEIKIKVTKIKLKYVFAQILIDQAALTLENSSKIALTGWKKEKNDLNQTSSESLNDRQMIKGSKITLTLPKTAKRYAKHIVILLKEKPSSSLFTEGNHSTNNTSSNSDSKKTSKYVLFLKNKLGAKFGDKVRVKFTKVGSTFAIGKILRIAPTSPLKKLARARKHLNEMLANGMHYGEKVVKCQAKMRSYIWNRKRSLPQRGTEKSPSNLKSGRVLISATPYPLRGEKGSQKKTGISNQGGKANLFIKGEKNSPLIKKRRHLINLLKTRRCLNIGLNQLTKYAAKGRTFLFVGTKKPAAGLIARAALFSKTSFFVNTRWLGGMLTNWKTIIKSISKIRPILKEKQKVISNILEKRAIIQNRLIKKVVSLRKKSKVLIKKGKQLIDKVKNSVLASGQNKKSGSVNNNVFSGLLMKRKALFERGQFLLQKRQSLLKKQNALKEKTLQIKESGFLIANKYKVLLNKLTVTHKKLHDIRLLFILNKELRNITKLAKEQGKNQYTLSYGQFKQFSNVDMSSFLGAESFPTRNVETGAKEEIFVKMSSKKLWLIPNPPEEILNKILVTISGLAANNSQTKSSSSPVFPSSAGERTKKLVNGLQNQSGLKKTMNFSVKEKNNASLPITNSKKSIVLTKLLSKFSRFLPYIKNAISSMLRLMLGMVKKMTELKTHLKSLKTKLAAFLLFNKKINGELKLIQKRYTSEQQIIRVLRRKLRRHEAEKKLLQFLPKLRFLPTPKSQIALAIQILMKRFVDPKMKYPMDLIYDEKLRKKSKKVAAARKKKWQRLETYFGGIANMTKLKKTQISNNVAIIVGQQEEMNAVLECKKLGIKMFHIVDTNCNPGLADHFIPSNDDSRNSIKYLLTKIVTRIRLAQKIRLRFKVLYKK